jgi:hypothetical protein
MKFTEERIVTTIVKKTTEIDCPNHVFIVAIQYQGALKTLFATSLRAVYDTYPGCKILDTCQYGYRKYLTTGHYLSNGHAFTCSDTKKPMCQEVDLLIE